VSRCADTRRHGKKFSDTRVALTLSNFDLRLAEVSRELETHISKQVLCSVVMKGVEDEGSSL